MPVQTKPSPKRIQESSSRSASESPAGQHASRWEWVAAGLGLAIVLGMLATIAYYGLTTGSAIPAVTVEHVGTEAIPTGYLVRFRAVNASSATAAALRIAGELRDADRLIEAGEAVLDYLPGYSERHGGMFFRQDPMRYNVVLYPVSYAEP